MPGSRLLRGVLLISVMALVGGCESDSGQAHKPTGSPTDPVVDCEKHGQVCRIDSSRLGVCIERKDPKTDARCQGRFPCLYCAPQH